MLYRVVVSFTEGVRSRAEVWLCEPAFEAEILNERGEVDAKRLGTALRLLAERVEAEPIPRGMKPAG
jgi:hypothetical protein